MLKAKDLRLGLCQMVYMCFKALVGNVLELLTLSILLLLSIFKLSMRLEQLLGSLNSQCYNEVLNPVKLPL